MAAITSDPESMTHSMTCMEIWGGNRATKRMVKLPGLNAWVLSQPYQQSETGGDVYYVSNCATGRITRLILADVSGHGTAVASMANHLRLLMRRFANHFQQLKFVSAINNEFALLAEAGGFATAVVATFLATTRRLTFSNAGHPEPFIFQAHDKKWRMLESRGDRSMKGEGPSDLPLGIFEDGRYAETEITLDPGDLVLFHTDALTESRDQSGNLIGSKGFLELVSAIEQPGSSQWLDAIVHRIKSLNSNNLTEDDFTLLLFCATGEANRISLGRRLLAPFRLLQGIAASIAEGGRGMPLPDFTSKSLTDGSNRPNRP